MPLLAYDSSTCFAYTPDLLPLVNASPSTTDFYPFPVHLINRGKLFHVSSGIALFVGYQQEQTPSAIATDQTLIYYSKTQFTLQFQYAEK